WAVYMYHEGEFSTGRVDPNYLQLTRVEDCQQTKQWPPLDDRVPSNERQQEILASLSANRQAGLPPCSEVVIQTRGELNWLMKQDIRPQPPDGAQAGRKHRLDLRRAIMRNANLDDAFFAGVYLAEVDFSGANLTNAKFQFADLEGANLTGAVLYRAHCYRA